MDFFIIFLFINLQLIFYIIYKDLFPIFIFLYQYLKISELNIWLFLLIDGADNVEVMRKVGNSFYEFLCYIVI